MDRPVIPGVPMLVEPTPALPPARAGRARLLVAIAAPIAILLATVASGSLGRDGAAPDASATSRPAAALPSAAAGPSPSGPVGPSPTASAKPVAFPPRLLGLTTRTVEQTLERRRADLVGDEMIAIKGWLTIQPDPTDCDLAPVELCIRSTLLADTHEQLLVRLHGSIEWAGPREMFHLHPAVMPGVRLPDIGDQELVPIPVVLLGRFDDPRLADPRTSFRHPNEALAIERVVTAASWELPAFVRDAGATGETLDSADIRARVSAALPSGTVVLSHAFVALSTLSRIDAEAAGRARAALQLGDGDDPSVWYVRLMVRDGNPVDTLAGDTAPRRVGWSVLAANGAILASRIGD